MAQDITFIGTDTKGVALSGIVYYRYTGAVSMSDGATTVAKPARLKIITYARVLHERNDAKQQALVNDSVVFLAEEADAVLAQLAQHKADAK